MNYTVENEKYTLTVSDTGAELVSLISKERGELIWQNPSGEFWKSHAPILFPVCGRIKDSRYTYGGRTYDMTTHGFISKKLFKVTESGENYITLEVKADEESLKNYPFDFAFKAKFELSGDEVIFSATVYNNGENTMPYMFGWHPGFNLPTENGVDIEDYSLDFGNIEKLSWIPLQNRVFARPYGEDYAIKNGKYTLCEKEIYENDTMIFEEHNNRVILSANKDFELDMSWSENLPTLCIWKDDDNAAKFLCIEPWTGTPNDGDTDENFDTRKMRRLAAHSKEEFFYKMKFSF